MAISAERLARNQTLFREVNERVLELVGADSAETMEFVCECSHAECTETIELDHTTYDAVRARPDCFLVVPGHEIAEIEVIVGDGDGYIVVRKTVAIDVMVATDPRARR